MSKQARIVTFGGAGLMIPAGIACAVVIGGVLGAVLALVLTGSGLVLVTSLVFLEVGLSEDRELARRAAVQPAPRTRPRPRAHRVRGHG